MALSPGSRAGAYDVLFPLGRGGMGEVYCARDRRLGRQVALKILPDAYADDPERRARFDREARALAALNHPNIAAIYGFEELDPSTGSEQNPVRALVMELVEGEDLSQRLARGSIPLDEAMAIARQIADALETAHEHGIVHRDLKPANVKVRSDGTVKVLDFGLARLAGLAPDGPGSRAADLATITSPVVATARGIILGTAAYMSPEQARGNVADRRSDVWAFGCVLYEALTGRRAFPGSDVPDTLAAVLRAEPGWSALPPGTPEPVRRLLRRCLEKDPGRRLPEFTSVRLEIDEALAAPPSDAPATVAAGRTSARAVWTVAAAAGLAALVLAALLLRPAAPPAGELHVDITTPPTTDPVSFAISPDGRKLVYVASVNHRSQLWLRSLESGAVRPLRGTEGARYPFWSPDSQSVGFFASEKVNRLDLDGDSVRPLARAVVGAGGTWNRNGTIVFPMVPDRELLRVSDSGGEATPLAFDPGPPGGHRFPQFLPDGRHFLFFMANPPGRGVYVGALDATERTRLFDADAAALYTAGHVVFVRGGALFAQAFDVGSLKTVGAPEVLAEHLAFDPIGSPAVSASDDGVIAYRTGSGTRQGRLTWFDRSGAQVRTVSDADPANPANLALSPDGARVAVNRSVEGNTDIWVLELGRDGLLTRLTFDPLAELCPIWSPDGRRILFARMSAGRGVVFQKPVAEAVEPSRVREDRTESMIPTDVSDDYLLYRVLNGPTGWDIGALPITGPGDPISVAATKYDERVAQFSPDRHWVAYESNESGRFEIYVQQFPGPGQKLQASVAGGLQPRWRADGKELFYLAPDTRLMAVPIQVAADGRKLQAGVPATLFAAPLDSTVQGGSGLEYAVSRDGRRFLINASAEQQSPPIKLILYRLPANR